MAPTPTRRGCELTADLSQAKRFLSIIDESADVFAFRTMKSDRDARNYTASFNDVSSALQLDNSKGKGVYVVINEGGHRAENITRVRAVFADCDTAGAPWPEWALEPHMIIESSPGKWHAYWLVDGLKLDDFRTVQRAIAALYGTDAVVSDLPRVMRLPGFYHTKAEPFLCKIIHESGALPYTADKILAAFQTVEPAREVAPAAGLGEVVAKDRHAAILKETLLLAASVEGGHMTRAEALDVMRQRVAAGRYTREVPDDELLRALDGALRKRMGASTTTAKPAISNAATLLGMDFAPVQWAVRGILPEGITILSGDPKIGKSWLLYQASIAVATGSRLWPGREPEDKGEALMLALEDTDRRLQRRLNTLLPYFTQPRGTQFVQPDVSSLYYTTEWPRAHAGVAQLREWLGEHPACRLVVIDTLSAFREKDLPKNKGAYAADYEVGEMFKPLAREFSCAIVLVMHNRKQHSEDALQLVSGTQGMTGGVDNVIVLKRERGKLDAGLYVDGRDIEDPQEIALKFGDGFWSGDGRTVEEARMSDQRHRLMRVVADLGVDARSRAICDAMSGNKPGTIRTLLSKMVKDGHLVLSDGVYTPPGTAVTAVTKKAA